MPMLFQLGQVNYIAVALAALAAFVFGFLVHGPVLGSVWIRLMKITPEEMEVGKKDMQKKMPVTMLVAFLQQLITACVLAHLFYLLDIGTVAEALEVAFWMWLGFVAMKLLDGVLWEKRSIPLYGFNVGYHLGSLVIMALIVGLWR